MTDAAIRWPLDQREQLADGAEPKPGAPPYDGYGYGFLAGFVAVGNKIKVMAFCGSKLVMVDAENVERVTASSVIQRGGGI